MTTWRRLAIASGPRRRAFVLITVVALSCLAATPGAAPRASAITLTQAAAPFVVQTAGPHQDGTGGVIVADTQEPDAAAGSNNLVLLVAALGALLGVLIVTRSRRGPE